jgi:hypothetical protein
MLMRKILITLLAAGSLGMICSCSKSPPAAANSTPDPNVPDRMKKQQQAINKASEEHRKQQESSTSKQDSATPKDESAPPMTSPTP